MRLRSSGRYDCFARELRDYCETDFSCPIVLDTRKNANREASTVRSRGPASRFVERPKSGRSAYWTHDLHKEVSECGFGISLDHQTSSQKDVGNSRHFRDLAIVLLAYRFACAIREPGCWRGIRFSPAGLSKKNITPMTDRRIAAGERTCAQFRRGLCVHSQAISAGLISGAPCKRCRRPPASSCNDGKVLIIPADDESTEVSFDKIMRKPALSGDNT